MAEEHVTLLVGDCREVLAGLGANTYDSVVTDPPYELAFMGKKWDGTGIAYDASMWREVLRVMKPGAHLVAFGGTRTHHRMMVAIENAGFEIRDCLMWLFGSGFPKSHNIAAAIDRKVSGTGPRGHAIAVAGTIQVSTGKPLPPGDNLPAYVPESPEAAQWDGWGTALKPAYEPIILARKPLSEKTVAANVLRWGAGAINVDASRIDGPIGGDPHRFAKTDGGSFNAFAKHPPVVRAAGRWPANVVLSHSLFCVPMGTKRVKGSRLQQNIQRSESHSESIGKQTDSFCEGYADPDGYETVEAWECDESCPVAMLDRQSGASWSTIGKPRRSVQPGNGYGMTATGAEYGDSGGASRFFYCAKASRAERDRGLAGLPLLGENGIDYQWKPGLNASPREDGHIHSAIQARNHHPTVKPIELMRYLCRLVTPPGGVILDPFMGSGSTGVAAIAEGFTFTGIDREEEYVEIAAARIRTGVALCR